MNKSIITASLVISSALITSCSYFGSDTKSASTNKTSKAARSIASVDGETPAQESVCDELIGQTPCLYGLCVAYCEAQDGPTTLNVDVPLEDQDFSVPNRKILSNYDKKMREGDPKMPCVNYTTSCPVWSQEELDVIGTQGGQAGDVSRIISADREYYQDFEYNSEKRWIAQIRNNFRSQGKVGYYYVYNYQTRRYEINRSQPLTDAEYDACKQQLIDHVANPL